MIVVIVFICSIVKWATSICNRHALLHAPCPMLYPSAIVTLCSILLNTKICRLSSDFCHLTSAVCHLTSGDLHPFGSRRLISLRSDLAISCGWRSDRLRLVVFLVSIWLAHDLRYTILPVPVVLKRLAAARLVLIFGILYSPCIKFFNYRFVLEPSL